MKSGRVSLPGRGLGIILSKAGRRRSLSCFDASRARRIDFHSMFPQRNALDSYRYLVIEDNQRSRRVHPSLMERAASERSCVPIKLNQPERVGGGTEVTTSLPTESSRRRPSRGSRYVNPPCDKREAYTDSMQRVVHHTKFWQEILSPGTPIYEMAKRRKGGYRLRSVDWRLFDKYSGRVLEFENFSLTYLKWVQIWCYIRLYMSHLRLRDLAELALQQYALVGRMAQGLLQQIVTDVLSRAQRRSGSRPS